MPDSLPSTTAPGASAEVQAAAFAEDDRIHFSKESGTWRLEQEDGTELEYDAAKGIWVPVVDEDLVKKQQAAYAVPGVDEEIPAAPVLKRSNKKRKGLEDISAAGPSNKRGRNDQEKPPRSKNTAVYVTGLPPDTEVEEVAERFSKFGVIEEDDEGEPKIKLYARDDGSFSGEALVVYFKEESVSLAINLLDDAELRIGDPSTTMRVQRAEFKHKHTTDPSDGNVPRRTVDKKKATRRIGKMQKKLQEWDDDDGFGPAKTEEDRIHSHNRSSRVVVLKHMFSLKELDEDPTLLIDLKEEVREECSSLGEVTNVVLYDKEPDGVMTIKYKEPLSAQACVMKMNGRYFAGRRIEASLYGGKQRFRRSGVEDDWQGDGEEAEKQRLDDFADWLMTEGE
ncbi:hypothetical protein EDD16DRAFT_1484363 [Pisolithus croceorrhizus]|nr:hypothetical protein EDD16DRAFT_1484363 [Pisolithus croceorrhizus]KAI6169306.1 hypothetical protein EDD17DRAFT_1517859 [Pisolithus thermaeus]